MYTNYIGLAVAEFVRGAYEDASDWARKTIQSRSTYPSSYRMLAASCALTGNLSEARNAIERFRKFVPSASIEGTRSRLPFKNDADMERYLDGLRKAGLPE